MGSIAGQSTSMFTRGLILVTAVALASAGCSGDPAPAAVSVPSKPSDISLVDDGRDCVDVHEGSEVVTGWCGSYITSFYVARAYTDPQGRYVLLDVVDATLLPSDTHEVWDTALNFVLIGTADAENLTVLVERDGKRLQCKGSQAELQCV